MFDKLHNPPPIPGFILFFSITLPSLYPLLFVVFPTAFQKENISPGCIIIPSILLQASFIFTALFCCNTGSTPFPFFIRF